jgi:hypothetical protein
MGTISDPLLSVHTHGTIANKYGQYGLKQESEVPTMTSTQE